MEDLHRGDDGRFIIKEDLNSCCRFFLTTFLKFVIYLQNWKLSTAQVRHLNFSFSNQAVRLSFYEEQLHRKLQTQVIENQEVIQAASIYHIYQKFLVMKCEEFEGCFKGCVEEQLLQDYVMLCNVFWRNKALVNWLAIKVTQSYHQALIKESHETE